MCIFGKKGWGRGEKGEDGERTHMMNLSKHFEIKISQISINLVIILCTFLYFHIKMMNLHLSDALT